MARGKVAVAGATVSPVAWLTSRRARARLGPAARPRPWPASASRAQGGGGQAFTVDARIRVPRHQVVLYRPGLLEVLKWGWVQFLATAWLVHGGLAALERLLFAQRVLETRVVSDVQPRGAGARF